MSHAALVDKRLNNVLRILGLMGVALADHGHKWTATERRLFTHAFNWLSCVCGADSAALN
jgi:hypothetical protein